MSQSVAEVVIDTLSNAGARRCWGIVGDTINHLSDAVRRSEMRWMHVRHEEVGALAAGGESYFTGELAVCAGSAGPGSLHFVNGLYESHRNGAPVVLIASDVARVEAGLNFPQQVDQRRIYDQHSVFCEYISHPDQARRITAMAAQAALTRRGAAVVIVNGDMFTETCADEHPWAVHRPSPVVRPGEPELEALAERINGAARVTLYAGIGARDAHDEVVALADALKAPVVHTSRAKEFLEPDNPFNVGMTGILGNRSGVEAMDGADLVLCLGTDFAWTQYYPDPKSAIQIDADPTHLGRRAPMAMALVGHVKDTIDALLPRLTPRDDRAHLDAALGQWSSDRDDYRKAGDQPDPSLIHPQFVANTLDRLAADDAFFTADGGTPMVWMLRHLAANGKRRFLNSLLHGTMAGAYPQAMGAAAAYPGRQIIAMCGDGGLSMLMGDLLTLKQENLPVKLVVFNNGALGFVEMEQRVEGLLDSFTGLENPDFAALARVIGLQGWRVDTANDLEDAMTAWLAADGPALLDVKVNRMELVMPPEITIGQVASTAMFGVRAIFDGRTGEVVSLLRNNFLR